jgi:PhzF family phenazine biosynthesis protein
MLGIEIEDIAAIPCWIDTGSEQLLVALQSADAVRRIKPNGDFAAHWPANRRGRRNVLAFALDERPEAKIGTERQSVSARYFFAGAQGVAEDPGTGSACANLGAWLAMQQRPLPLHMVIHQGDLIDRPSRLLLDVTSTGEILVGGRVIELGQGWLDLPA